MLRGSGDIAIMKRRISGFFMRHPMTTRHRIILIGFFAFCGLAAWGVYWWHEASLDRIAMEYVRYSGPKLDEIQALLEADKPAEARATLERLPQYQKVGILKVLDRDRRTNVRMFAVRCMRGMRDVPAIRAELARLAQQDPEASVARLASRTLHGRR